MLLEVHKTEQQATLAKSKPKPLILSPARTRQDSIPRVEPSVLSWQRVPDASFQPQVT